MCFPSEGSVVKHRRGLSGSRWEREHKTNGPGRSDKHHWLHQKDSWPIFQLVQGAAHAEASYFPRHSQREREGTARGGLGTVSDRGRTILHGHPRPQRKRLRTPGPGRAGPSGGGAGLGLPAVPFLLLLLPAARDVLPAAHRESFVPRRPPASPGSCPAGLGLCSPSGTAGSGSSCPVPSRPLTARCGHSVRGARPSEPRPAPHQTAGTPGMANTPQLPSAPQWRSVRKAHNEFLSGKNTVIIPQAAPTFNILAIACPLPRVRVPAQNSYLRL